jgi:hypothetical protein
MAQGWAVVEGDLIDLRTVSETRRAAIVNWLVVRPRIMVYASWDDEDIEYQWNNNRNLRGAEVIKVNIEKA